MKMFLLSCTLLATSVFLGGCNSFSSSSSQNDVVVPEMRLQKVHFADGSIEYTLTAESAEIMQRIETVQAFNLNGNNQMDLAEIEVHRLFVATDVDGNRNISVEEANAFYNQISNVYEQNLGQPSQGNRRR